MYLQASLFILSKTFSAEICITYTFIGHIWRNLPERGIQYFEDHSTYLYGEHYTWGPLSTYHLVLLQTYQHISAPPPKNSAPIGILEQEI